MTQQARNLLMNLGDGFKLLITGERHLRLVLSEYTDHANPRVLRRDQLGGLIREFPRSQGVTQVFAPTARP